MTYLREAMLQKDAFFYFDLHIFEYCIYKPHHFPNAFHKYSLKNMVQAINFVRIQQIHKTAMLSELQFDYKTKDKPTKKKEDKKNPHQLIPMQI